MWSVGGKKLDRSSSCASASAAAAIDGRGREALEVHNPPDHTAAYSSNGENTVVSGGDGEARGVQCSAKGGVTVPDTPKLLCGEAAGGNREGQTVAEGPHRAAAVVAHGYEQIAAGGGVEHPLRSANSALVRGNVAVQLQLSSGA